MDIEVCKTCKFYLTDDYDTDGVTYERTYGMCRRYPPRRIDGLNSGSPVVEDDGWCGEYQKNLT